MKRTLLPHVRPMLDSLIDQSLECQEDVARGKIHSLPEFLDRLAKILDFKSQYHEIFNGIISKVSPLQGKQVCSSVVEYLSLGFMSQYDKQTHHFKQLVSSQNMLMPFYIAVLNLDPNQQMPRKLSLHQLKSVLQGKKELLCTKCGHYSGKTGNFQKHKSVCDGAPIAGKLLLTLKQGAYLCQLGCPGQLSERDIIIHMIQQHTDKDLEGWGMNKVILQTMLKIKSL